MNSPLLRDNKIAAHRTVPGPSGMARQNGACVGGVNALTAAFAAGGCA